MADINEQWLDMGECSVCRRRNYCSKPCKRGQMRRQREMAAIIAKAVVSAMNRAASKDLEK